MRVLRESIKLLGPSSRLPPFPRIPPMMKTSTLGLTLVCVLACLTIAGDAVGQTTASSSLKPLFNGIDLDGWKHSGNWSVVNGEITRNGRGGSLVYAESKVPDDFELVFEWKVAPGTNSGVYYRPGQYEYQILDNDKHADGKNPRTSAASLYFCIQPSEDATGPVGTWNQGRIVCKGTVIQHWLNGKKVVHMDYDDPKWAFNVNLLKQRGGNLDARGGSLSLQDHGDPVWYRNIQMRALAADEAIDLADVEPAEISDEVLAAENKKLRGIIERRNKAKAK